MDIETQVMIENWSNAFWELIINEAMHSNLDLNDKKEIDTILHALAEVVKTLQNFELQESEE